MEFSMSQIKENIDGALLAWLYDTITCFTQVPQIKEQIDGTLQTCVLDKKTDR